MRRLFGPASALPTCSQFLRPRTIGRIEFPPGCSTIPLQHRRSSAAASATCSACVGLLCPAHSLAYGGPQLGALMANLFRPDLMRVASEPTRGPPTTLADLQVMPVVARLQLATNPEFPRFMAHSWTNESISRGRDSIERIICSGLFSSSDHALPRLKQRACQMYLRNRLSTGRALYKHLATPTDRAVWYRVHISILWFGGNSELRRRRSDAIPCALWLGAKGTTAPPASVDLRVDVVHSRP